MAEAEAEAQARQYAELLDMHSRDAAEFLEQWKSSVMAALQQTKAHTIWFLDYGCGTCPYVETFLAEWQKDIGKGQLLKLVCCDPDASRLNVAREQHRARVERGELVLVRADETSLAEEVSNLGICGFDFILSSYVFHFVANKEACIGALCQVLNPGGHLLITTTEDTSPDSLAGRILFSMEASSSKEQPEIEHRVHRIKQCFIKRGADIMEMAKRVSQGNPIADLTLEVGTVEYRYDSLQHLFRWFFAMTHGAFDAAFIPAARRAALEHEHPGQVVLCDQRFRLVLVSAR